MQAPEILGPPLPEMFGNGVVELVHQSSAGNSERTRGFYEASQVVQIGVIGPVVREGIDGDDGVKEFIGEWQRPGLGVDREDPILDAGVTNPLNVLGGAEPQIGRPDLYPEFAAQKDG